MPLYATADNIGPTHLCAFDLVQCPAVVQKLIILLWTREGLSPLATRPRYHT